MLLFKILENVLKYIKMTIPNINDRKYYSVFYFFISSIIIC